MGRKRRTFRTFGKLIGLPMVDHFGYRHLRVTDGLDWHWHRGFEFVFMLAGEATYELTGGLRLRVAGGQYSLMQPAISHRGIDGLNSPGKLCWIAFDPTCRGAMRNTGFDHDDLSFLYSKCRDAGNTSRVMSQRMLQLLQQVRDIAVALDGPCAVGLKHALARPIVCQLITEATSQLSCGQNRVRHQLVTAALAWMNEHMAEPVRMPLLARHVGASPASIYRAFKTEVGQTPNDYLQRLRVQAAQKQLQASSHSTTQIAMELGFASGQYFSHVFRKYTGQSPGQFRTGLMGRQ